MAGKETRATALLARREVTHTVREYEHDPRSESYGAEAATALGVDTARVLKTLIVTVDSALVTAVVPVRHQLDLKAVAVAVGGKKATMADSATAQRVTGMSPAVFPQLVSVPRCRWCWIPRRCAGRACTARRAGVDCKWNWRRQTSSH